MSAARCSCGFSETGDEGLGDHFLEVFAPGDCRGSDGQVHEEMAEPSLTCSCGLVAASVEAMDEHFMRAFAPGDATGRDGRRHEPAVAPAAW